MWDLLRRLRLDRLQLNRRVVIGAAAGSIAVASVVLLAWAPRLVESRIVERIRDRTGLPVTTADISVGLFGVRVGAIHCGSGQGPKLEIKNVAVDASLFSLALRGTRGLGQVTVDQVDVELPLNTPEAAALIARLTEKRGSGKESGSGGQSSSGDAPTVQVQRLAIQVNDEHGSLLKVSDGTLRADGSGVELVAERVQLGGAPSAALAMDKVRIRAARTSEGMRLSAMTVGQAALHAAAGAVAGDDPAQAAAQAPAAPSILKRIRAQLPKAAEPGAGAAPAAGPSAAVQRAIARLAPGAEIKLERGSLYPAPDGPPALTDLKASVTLRADNALALSGSGKSHAGGSLGWDLTLQPERAQADGKIELQSIPLSMLVPFLPAVPWYEPEQGRIDAELVVKTEPSTGVSFSGEMGLRNGAVSHARISATPVHGIDVALQGKGRFLPVSSRLELEQAELRVRNAKLAVAGAMEWTRDHYLFDIDATLPPTPCTEAVRSIPEDLLGDMALASWRGKIGGTLKVRLDSRDLDKTELDIDPEERCEFTTVPAMADLRRFQFPFTHTALEPDGTEFEMETGPGTPNWTSIDDISPYFLHAVLVHEDGGFFKHHGFSMMHIRDALVRNLKEGRYVVGASTITMQLVKNVFLHREKTLARKIQEVLLTWWVEGVMEKRDILELYLNVIEYGPNVYGIRDGAKHYFNRLPAQLSPAESVFLSTILPNPKGYHSFFEKGALSASWTEQIRRMFARLRERGAYSPEAADYGLSELDDFRFVPEGQIPQARIIPGAAAPLPYMPSYEEGKEDLWDTAGTPTTDQDEGAFAPLPVRTSPLKPASGVPARAPGAVPSAFPRGAAQAPPPRAPAAAVPRAVPPAVTKPTKPAPIAPTPSAR